VCRPAAAFIRKAIEVVLVTPFFAFISRQESHGSFPRYVTIANEFTLTPLRAHRIATGRNGLIKQGLMISGKGNGNLSPEAMEIAAAQVLDGSAEPSGWAPASVPAGAPGPV
jgi:hypothetical protein